MRLYCWDLLRLGSRCGFADEFCFLDGGYRLPHEVLFVIDDRDILFGQVANLVVGNFPKFLRYLRDEAEVVRDDDHAALEVLDSPGESINRCHVQVISGFICKPSMMRIQTLEQSKNASPRRRM